MTMIKKPYTLLLPLILTAVTSCNTARTKEQQPEPCTQAWYSWVETTLSSGDGRGHGPDVGSEEWQSVIEFKLGIRGKADIPPRNSEDWCLYISDQLASAPIRSSLAQSNSSTTTGALP